MGATLRTCFLIIAIQLINNTTAQETDKRVPQGFLGMRGKKYFSSDEVERYYKRKPQFFVGVKGKKNAFDDWETPEPYYKRAPMGFVGMRGKKDPYVSDASENYEYVPKTGSLIGQIDYVSNEEPKNLQLPELPLLNELLMKYLARYENQNTEATEDDDTKEYMTNEVKKRASNIHQFFGVRGKKSMQNKRPFDLSFRGKFIGVRGKKDVRDSGAQDQINFLLDNNEPWPKRRQMGFVGMRGKKLNDESSIEVETPN